MKKAFIASLFVPILLTILVTPFAVSAAEIKGLGSYILPSEERVEGNVYVAAGEIEVHGIVHGDLVGMGGNIIQEGIIEGDTTLLGGNIYASSTIKGDVRIIGGTVKIGGIIDGDLVAAGATVEVLPHTIITGDIIVLGGQAIINNVVTGKLKIIAGEAIINGRLEGLSDITAPTVVFRSHSQIVGDTAYFSHRNARIEPGAQGTDHISFNQIQWIKDTSSVKKVAVSFINFWLLLQFINTLLLSFILLFVFKPFSQQIAQDGATFFWKNALVGLGALILLPIISVIFIASLFALSIGVLAILIFAIVYVISSAYSAMIVGIFIKRYILRKKDDEIDFQLAVAGAGVIAILNFIPVVGNVIQTILFLVTIGVLYRHLYAMIKS